MPWGYPSSLPASRAHHPHRHCLVCTMLVWPALVCQGCTDRAGADTREGQGREDWGTQSPLIHRQHLQMACLGVLAHPISCLLRAHAHCLHPALGAPGPSASPCLAAWRCCSRAGLDTHLSTHLPPARDSHTAHQGPKNRAEPGPGGWGGTAEPQQWAGMSQTLPGRSRWM